GGPPLPPTLTKSKMQALNRTWFPKSNQAKQSIMKPIPQFQINLARIIPMISAERKTIVILDAPVRHVERRHRRSEPIAEILAHRKIERRVLRQVIPRIRRARKSIAETRPVINVAGEI